MSGDRPSWRRVSLNLDTIGTLISESRRRPIYGTMCSLTCSRYVLAVARSRSTSAASIHRVAASATVTVLPAAT